MSTKFGTENAAAMPLCALCGLCLRVCGGLSHFPDKLPARCGDGSGLLCCVCGQSSGQKMPLFFLCKPCAACGCGFPLYQSKSRTKCPAAALLILCGFRRILPDAIKGDALRLFPLRDAGKMPHLPPGSAAMRGYQIGCAAAGYSVTFGDIR